ncbi:unnamed protein product [Lampetra fluviatilis]
MGGPLVSGSKLALREYSGGRVGALWPSQRPESHPDQGPPSNNAAIDKPTTPCHCDSTISCSTAVTTSIRSGTTVSCQITTIATYHYQRQPCQHDCYFHHRQQQDCDLQCLYRL